MTTIDPQTGERFAPEEMVDQVAIFFLAGHETSASALAWTLYLLATHPDWQERAALEAQGLVPEFSHLSRLRVCRDVFREALRLYQFVPMIVRETTRPETFRGRTAASGAPMVLSPWHLHRHEKLWQEPDRFDPGRWSSPAAQQSQRESYVPPLSAGPRVCPGAGFAMAEGVLLLALSLRAFRLEPVEARVPRPVAHLTVRSGNGIWLRLAPRELTPESEQSGAAAPIGSAKRPIGEILTKFGQVSGLGRAERV